MNYNNTLRARILNANTNDEIVYVMWQMYNLNIDHVDFGFLEKINKSDVTRLNLVKVFIDLQTAH